MKASQRYIHLIIQHAKLHVHLLPKTYDIMGIYSEQTITHTLAYCLLSHAEIESYLEERAYDTATKAITAWQNNKKVSKVLLGLLAFSGQKVYGPPNSVDLEELKEDDYRTENIKLTHRIKRAMGVFCHNLGDNHGVKEKNIYQLLLPIGIEADEIENDLIADLNSYGEKRGSVAHSSAAKFRTTQQIDPKTESRKVKSIIARLIKIDKKIDKLLLEISS